MSDKESDVIDELTSRRTINAFFAVGNIGKKLHNDVKNPTE